MLTERQDAEGRAFLDHLEGKAGNEIVERDDGFISVSAGPEIYFAPYEDWPECEKRAMSYVRGTVLDVGCGAGRHLLCLQARGVDAVGIDVSPVAVKVCKARGLTNVWVLPVTKVSSRLGVFDTILMMGNNFGLFGSLDRARWLLRRFHSLCSAQGRIVAESRDPHATELPEHLEYHQRNLARGRMPGQVRLRVRYKTYSTPWHDYLLVSEQEMTTILENTGWRLAEVIKEQSGLYVAVIDKTPG
jgi:hypothetical protein